MFSVTFAKTFTCLQDEDAKAHSYKMRSVFHFSPFIFCLPFFICAHAHAQALADSKVVEQSSLYVSPVDASLTIRRITLLPVVDNVSGIYARPLESLIEEKLKSKHQFDFEEFRDSNEIPTFEELTDDPNKVKPLLDGHDVDAALAARVVRGPKGISINLVLFLKADGKVLLQVDERDINKSDLASVKEEVLKLYDSIFGKLPYDGFLLSRQGERVTMNLGRLDGIQENQILSAIQIIKLERHPKFNFLIRTEKEVLGKIRVLKVEDTLSFGRIIVEKEKGAIGKLTKISGSEFVTYDQKLTLSNETVDYKEHPAFGKDPKEWKPLKAASFGQIGLRLGLSHFSSNTNIPSVGNLDSSTSIAPSIALDGELWVTSNFIASVFLRQGIMQLSNPRTGSTPEDLSVSTSAYRVLLGYQFMLEDSFWGPKLEAQVGYAQYRSFVDDSQPRAFTTMQFSGLQFGLRGGLPITEEKDWFAGAGFVISYDPKLKESPVTSGGSSKNTVNTFNVYVQRKLRENLRATGNIDFEMYSANFSGRGSRGSNEIATSASQQNIMLSGGIYYLF